MAEKMVPPTGQENEAGNAASKPEENTPPATPPKQAKTPAPTPAKAEARAPAPKQDVEDEEDPAALSAEERARITAEVRAMLLKERKKSAMEQFRSEEIRRMRMEQGLVVGGVQDDMVTITLDLAKHSAHILVDQRPYWHGQTYTVPRHIANSLAEAQWRGWQHQYEIDGKTRFDFYAGMRETVISPVKGIKRAPQRPDAPVNGISG